MVISTSQRSNIFEEDKKHQNNSLESILATNSHNSTKAQHIASWTRTHAQSHLDYAKAALALADLNFNGAIKTQNKRGAENQNHVTSSSLKYLNNDLESHFPSDDDNHTQQRTHLTESAATFFWQKDMSYQVLFEKLDGRRKFTRNLKDITQRLHDPTKRYSTLQAATDLYSLDEFTVDNNLLTAARTIAKGSISWDKKYQSLQDQLLKFKEQVHAREHASLTTEEEDLLGRINSYVANNQTLRKQGKAKTATHSYQEIKSNLLTLTDQKTYLQKNILDIPLVDYELDATSAYSSTIFTDATFNHQITKPNLVVSYPSKEKIPTLPDGNVAPLDEDEFRNSKQKPSPKQKKLSWKIPAFAAVAAASIFSVGATTTAHTEYRNTLAAMAEVHNPGIIQLPHDRFEGIVSVRNPTIVFGSQNTISNPALELGMLHPDGYSPPLDRLSVSSTVKMRDHPILTGVTRPHRGLDLQGDMGTPIYAQFSGKSCRHTLEGYGLLSDTHTTLETTTGVKGSVMIRDAHLSAYPMGLTKAPNKRFRGTCNEIKKGDILGRIGSSGMAKRPHLHQEWYMTEGLADELAELGVVAKVPEYLTKNQTLPDGTTLVLVNPEPTIWYGEELANYDFQMNQSEGIVIDATSKNKPSVDSHDHDLVIAYAPSTDTGRDTGLPR